MKALLSFAVLLAASHSFAAAATTNNLQCDGASVSIKTVVTSENGADTIVAHTVDTLGRQDTFFTNVDTAKRLQAEAAGLNMFGFGGDRVIDTPELTMKIVGSIMTVSGKFNETIKCLDLTSDNPTGN